MSELVIAHISDTHITNGPEFRKDFFMKAIDEINGLTPDLVIHTGDLTSDGLKEDFQMAKDLLSWFDIKPIVLMGNHDSKNVGYRLFEDYIGPRDPIHEDENFLFIGVDSSIPDRNEGLFGRMHMRWVADVLRKKGDGKVKILGFHHHIVPVPNAGRERSMIFDAGNVLKMILDYGVDIVLNGHRHVCNIYRVEDTAIINAGTLTHVKTRAYHGQSYNVIRISDKEARVTIRRMDSDSKEECITKVGCEERLIHVDLPRIARVIQISDTHFERGDLFHRMVYESAVRIINGLRPDIVVHCGDVTEDGMPESFEMARRLLKKIKAPMIIVPGPNDFMNMGDLIFEDYIGTLSPIFRDENFIVVGVNSVHRDCEGGVIGRTSLRQILEELVRQNHEVIRFLSFHHHLMPLPHVREEHALEDAGNVLASVIGNADVVLTGHRHISSSLMIDGCLVSNCGTLSNRKYQNPYGNTFNMIDVFNNGSAVVSEINVPTGLRRIVGVYKIRPEVKDHEKARK
ncbi:MAG: metallophosphoesterase family protein [Candidatus Hodarchaeota archaeon]